MSISLIYAKTAQGAEEIRTRAAGLSATARRVLIMIDGKRDEDELRLVVREGELDGVIATLLAQGLIEACGMAEPPEREWLADDAATVAMEATGLRLDLGLGEPAGAAAVTAPPPAAPSSASLPPSRAAGPPPTLRMAIADVDRRTPAPVPAPVPAPTTIVIKPIRTRQAPAPSADQEAATASLEEAKRNAVRALYERLGPYGEEPAARINDCKSHEALREQIRHACRRITTFRGAPAAREYLASIGMA
jgi:hypothetical protein